MLALLGLLTQILLPALTSGSVQAGVGNASETIWICTPEGLKPIPIETPGSGGETEGAPPCPLCLLGGPSAVLPTFAATAVDYGPDRFEVRCVPPVSVLTAQITGPPQPARGPPAR